VRIAETATEAKVLAPLVIQEIIYTQLTDAIAFYLRQGWESYRLSPQHGYLRAVVFRMLTAHEMTLHPVAGSGGASSFFHRQVRFSGLIATPQSLLKTGPYRRNWHQFNPRTAVTRSYVYISDNKWTEILMGYLRYLENRMSEF